MFFLYTVNFMNQTPFEPIFCYFRYFRQKKLFSYYKLSRCTPNCSGMIQTIHTWVWLSCMQNKPICLRVFMLFRIDMYSFEQMLDENASHKTIRKKNFTFFISFLRTYFFQNQITFGSYKYSWIFNIGGAIKPGLAP